LHGANASLSARESKIGAGGRPRGWHRSRTVGSPRVESCLLRFDPCLLRKDGYSDATEHKSERNGETYRAFTRGCPRDILDIGPRRACCRRHNSAQKRNNFETEVVIQQRHDVDRLVDLTNAEQNLISKLGILGIQIDSKIAATLADLRRSSGVIARRQTHVSCFPDAMRPIKGAPMNFDAITVGGGLAGSTFAAELTRAGHQVLVLERETRFKDRVRGENMLPWGVAAARRLGLVNDLLAA